MTAERPDPVPASPDLIVRYGWSDPGAVDVFIDVMRRSTSPEHFIYREAECDEFWRYLEDEIAEEDDRLRLEALEGMKTRVMRAHDLVAEGQAVEAADELEDGWQRWGARIPGA